MNKRPFNRLLRYCGKHRGAIWLATLFSVLNKLFDLAPPILIGAAVDIVVSKEEFVHRRARCDLGRHSALALGGNHPRHLGG